jgi:U4/U6 small nuclear ribonucleoprotein PRP3
MAEEKKRSEPEAGRDEGRTRKRTRWGESAPVQKAPPARLELQKQKEALQKQRQVQEKLRQAGFQRPNPPQAPPAPAPQQQTRKQAQRSKGEELLNVGRRAAAEEVSSSASLDRRIDAASQRSRRKQQSAALSFFSGGEVQSSIQEDRRRLGVPSWDEAQADNADDAPSAADDVSHGPAKRLHEEPPEVEWWDRTLLATGRYDSVEDPESPQLNERKLTHYIEHPVQLGPAGEKPLPEPQPLKLTKKEQRKLRKQRREARERERQDLIRQGLMEPPKPKVKISNLAHVMGANNSADPTSIEKEVRKQEQERAEAHEDRNEARKLTPSERAEKKRRKMFDDDPTDVYVTLYRVERLNDRRQRFKVEANARQNQLTGVAINTDAFALVVVEGCNKSQQRFNKLMLRRIDWNSENENAQSAPGAAHEEQQTHPNKCERVWGGKLDSRTFSRFTIEDKAPKAARAMLEDHNVPQYWDLASAMQEGKSNVS